MSVTRAGAATDRDRARRSEVEERWRASRAADIAARHELLTTTGPDWLRQFHQVVAEAHRKMEARHLAAAGIQASHAEHARVSPSHADQDRIRPTEMDDAGQDGTRDSLTGLPSRSFFIEQLGDAIGWNDVNRRPIATHRRIGICQLGIDNFQAVNDWLGRRTGDHLLISVANRLAERFPDHLVARMAGDRFAILLIGTSSVEDATRVADAALAAADEPFRVDGTDLSVSASIGVVERPVAGADVTGLLRAADVTMGWAKSGGRGRWALYEVDRDERETARQALAAALPAAIDRGELFLEYQPIVALRDGAIIAAEALVRWRHPALGVLYPDAFIDIAEQSNVISQLGRHVLTQACRDAARWRELTADPPRVSVNIAARQLRDADIAADVMAALEQAGLPPSHLQLEVTESSIVEPHDRSISVLRELVDMGIRISIDDFGTGYSSLSYLRHLPAQNLKIDRSFVSELDHTDKEIDATATQILMAMVSLANVLGLTATAEGVETADQAEILRSVGCDSAQGWRFGRPVEAHKFAEIITTRVR